MDCPTPLLLLFLQGVVGCYGDGLYVSRMGVGHVETYSSRLQAEGPSLQLDSVDCAVLCGQRTWCLGIEVNADNECRLRTLVLINAYHYQPAPGVQVYAKEYPTNYIYVGCYRQDELDIVLVKSLRDNSGGGVQAVNWDHFYQNIPEIIQMCAALCQARGYSHFSLVAFAECWTQDNLAAKLSKPVPEDNCPNNLGVHTGSYAAVYKFD